ncbi:MULTISPECIES: cobalt-precorrin-6A reductase [unclassified Luteococcus]|uniref:cobalt-precorrin-6A reductase n=1 Tax=unclassified Luteococcus TaxID=2639923 RepID=UPI00313CAB68
MTLRVLILGGTTEGRELAKVLAEQPDVSVLSSLAGAVPKPRLPVGQVRIGGFGGVDGLRAALAEIDVVVDATHPFAQGMSANAAAACATPLPDGRRIPLLRLERPAWPVEDGWHLAATHEQAAELAADLGKRPFVTVGRNELARYLPALGGCAVLARMVQAPDLVAPDAWRIITSRGPYTFDGDLAIMREHGTDVLVTKNSGGHFTRPKMDVARELGIPCVVVERPHPADGVETVSDVDEAAAWVLRQR